MLPRGFSTAGASYAIAYAIEHSLNYGQTPAMARNPRYDVLFEPVRIGPVESRNRFYAVPHAAGMTNSMPHMRAAFRGT